MDNIHSLDILVPVYNEEQCLKEFGKRLLGVLENRSSVYSVLFVDDGSTDGSLPIIKDICNRYPRCGYIRLSRNFGKEAAMSAGIDFSQSDALVIIDADLQDPPELIPNMVALLEREHADVVYAKRRVRHGDTWFKKKCARLFYRLFDAFSRFSFPQDTGDFRVLRHRVVVALQRMDETNRFMKGLFAWVGYQQVEFLYDRDRRHQGNSKFNFFKLLNFAWDGITAFTVIPIKLATCIGSLFALSALLFGVYFIIKTLLWGDPVRGFPTLIVAVSFFSGVQLLFLGIIGEYVARTNIEVKKRPLYLIDEQLLPEGLNEEPVPSKMHYTAQ
ncbi:MAG TPA: glycosyltransferase [Desulfobulbaceae bacterium]|nr:glycosyltransferase [Desulfobulbaceae bacterium]